MKVHPRLQQGCTGDNIRLSKEAEAVHDHKEISGGTGLAYQTVHRYMQYLMGNGSAELKLDYGRQGRPRNRYFMKRGEVLNDK